MENIVGREEEIKELDQAFVSKEAEFIAVYGRRRVGKTYLIRNFFQKKNCIYFQTTGIYKATVKQQLERFAKEIGASFYQGASINKPANWMAAFDELTRALNLVPKNKKIVLFFDELPWMATSKSGLVAALEYFWNREWVNDGRIKLVICGSSASWIINKIIKNRGGLHNRITRKMKLMLFDLNSALPQMA